MMRTPPAQLCLVVVAAIAAFGAGCAGSNSDPSEVQDPLTGLEASEGSATDSGTDSSASIESRPEDGIPNGPPGSGGSEDEAAGGGLEEVEPEWFTPYEERVSPLAVFIDGLRAEVSRRA